MFTIPHRITCSLIKLKRGMGSSDCPASRLDDEFKKMVEQLKPFVLQLQDDKERRLVRLWIRKIASQTIQSLTDRKNRNLYGLLLLKMLRNGVLKEPFTSLPAHGRLPTIPAYMASYLDSDNYKESDEFSDLSWLQGSYIEDSLAVPHGETNNYEDLFTPRRREKFLLSFDAFSNNPDTLPTDMDHLLDDFDISDLHLPSTAEERLLMQRQHVARESESLAKEEEAIYAKEQELETKLRKLDERMQEEVLRVQQQHDSMVKKILDRKNNEISDMKSHYQHKINDLEDCVLKQNEQVYSLNAEMSAMETKHTEECQSMNKTLEKRMELAAKEYEKIMFEKLNVFEQEMCDMQRKHRENIHEVVDEADHKLSALKLEMGKENANLKKEIKRLTEKLSLQGQNSTTADRLKDKFLKEKEELQEQIFVMNSLLEKTKTKVSTLLQENCDLVGNHEDEMKRLKTENKEVVRLLKSDQRKETADLNAENSHLRKQINQLEATVETTKSQNVKHLKEIELSSKQKQLDLESMLEQKVSRLGDDFERKEMEYQAKITKGEFQISHKDEEIRRLILKLESHVQETNTAVESFKKQAEDDSNEMFRSLTSQLDELQHALATSKQKFEDQRQEFELLNSNQRKFYEKQIKDNQKVWQQEKTNLTEHFRNEKSDLYRQLIEQKDLNKTLERDFALRDKKLHQQAANQNHVISELEMQAKDLRAEVLQANTLRKDQIKELGYLVNEEKQKAKESEDLLKTNHQRKLDELTLRLQKDQNTHLKELTAKMEDDLKKIEEEYKKKSDIDHNTISTFQDQISSHSRTMKEKKFEFEDKLNDITSSFTEERKSLHDQLQQWQEKCGELEKRYQNEKLYNQQDLSRCRAEYEGRLRGMISQAMQKDFEETIVSLKEQIHMVQSRADVLQEELVANSTFKTRHSAPWS